MIEKCNGYADECSGCEDCGGCVVEPTAYRPEEHSWYWHALNYIKVWWIQVYGGVR